MGNGNMRLLTPAFGIARRILHSFTPVEDSHAPPQCK
jgi:hypothetical protein